MVQDREICTAKEMEMLRNQWNADSFSGSSKLSPWNEDMARNSNLYYIYSQMQLGDTTLEMGQLAFRVS